MITANNNKTEDTGERKSEKDSETSISNNKSSQKDISHEVEPTNTLNSQENIENKDFMKATVSCMEDYMKLSLTNPPDHFILHVGTNDLSSEKCSLEITESIINLTCRLKNEIHDVNVSTIILRTDDKKNERKGDGSKFTFKRTK